MPIINAGELEFQKLPRQEDWRGLFNAVDNNFEKIRAILTGLGTRIKVNRFVAQKGQKLFNLDSEYLREYNNLEVYRNGVRQFLETGFIEVSSSSFSLTDPCDLGDDIVAVYFTRYVVDDQRSFDQRIIDEIKDARVGFDGVNYGTLSESIRGQIMAHDLDFASTLESINQSIEDLKGQIDTLDQRLTDAGL